MSKSKAIELLLQALVAVIWLESANTEAVINCGVEQSSSLVDSWKRYEAFLTRFGRRDEFQRGADCMKFEIFQRNERKAQELNGNPLDDAEYSAEFSPFGDLSESQFKSQILMPSLQGQIENFQRLNETSMSLQANDAMDWTTKPGVVTPIKDQGTLGTCYIFSAAGVVEGQLAIKYGLLNRSISVEHSLECNSLYDSKTNNAVCGVFGGWPYLVMDFWKQPRGFVADQDWPYCAGIVDKSLMPYCFPCMVNGYSEKSCGEHDDFYCNASSTGGQGKRRYCSNSDWLSSHKIGSVKNWQLLSSDESQLAEKLQSLGPLSATMDATMLQLYRRGVANPLFCSKTSLNHSILLVGFGNDQGKSFWKAKASWGEKWGEKGFFRIVRGKGKCGINTAVVTATLA